MESPHTKDSSRPAGAAANEGGSFWRTKTIAELAAEQGVPLIADFDALFGEGKDLWSDEEFETFLTDLRESRREGR
jgi:hypothetical protein